MTEQIRGNVETQSSKPPLTLLVFGSGPVVDKDNRKKAAEAGTLPGNEDINFWSKTLANSADELIKRGVAASVIFMGGRTGGPQFKSEAELMRNQIGYGETEDRSTNTLENVVNLINLYIDNPDAPKKRFGLVAQNHHLPRVKLLMEMFGVPFDEAFSAEEVARFVARSGGQRINTTLDSSEWDHQTLTEIEQRLDMNTDGYYRNKIGTETRSVHERGQEENVYSRGLLDKPDYWLKYVGMLDSEDRVRTILTKLDPEVLNSFNIDLSENISVIKQKLGDVPRDMKTIEEWLNHPQPWPKTAVDKLDKILEERRS